MAQPPGYTPVVDFSDEEATAVGGRSTVRTAALDAEFAALNTTADAILVNLSLNQRDDGEIRDARVKLFTLSTDVLAYLIAAGAAPRGAWLTATAYVVKDVVTQSTNTYICAVAHTSGVFATDLTAVKWILISLGTTTTFTATAGSAASPSYTFTGDTDTGIYSSAANEVAISTNGVNRLTATSTGTFSITAPTSGTALSVNGLAGANRMAVFNGSYAEFQLAGTAYGYLGDRTGVIGAGAGVALRAEGQLDLATGGVNPRINITSAGVVTINAPSAGIALTVNGAATGNYAKFVAANSAAGYIGLFTGVTQIGYFGDRNGVTGGTALDLALRCDTNLALASGGSERIVMSTAGNVTINVPSSGNHTVTGGLLEIGTGGIGYATGAGGTVTQATSKATGATLNKSTGTITMNGAALNATTSVSFVFTNSTIAATDVVCVSIKSGATLASYFVQVDAVAAGSCTITVRNYTAGNLSEAVVLSFVVVKGVAA